VKDRDSSDAECEEDTRDEGQRMSPMLIQALAHPVRRESLRLLHQTEEARSATQLSEHLARPSDNIGYHLRVLADLGVAQQTSSKRVRGATEKFFVSTVADHRQLVSILADTAKDDEWIRR
jgi:DNA-binding transcriptional ArsR family regulator